MDRQREAPTGRAGRGRQRRSQRETGERGAVTAELALGLPLLLALTVGLVWLLALGTAQVQVVDASREAARALARGDDEAASLRVARRIAPSGARITIRHEEERVVVTTKARVRGPGGLFDVWPAVDLAADAVAVREGS